MHLTKNTVIQRSPNLNLELRNNQLFVDIGGRESACGYHAFAVLDIFSVPRTLEEGLNRLAERLTGKWDWTNLTAEVRRLIAKGVLVPDLSIHKTLHSHNARFDAAEVHIRMLNDEQRTRAYSDALNAVVTEHSVVVDVGTGTGILAALAARAGARKVYAIERSSNLAKFASDFFEKNGLSEKITVLEGVASQVEIPEKADVMVTETIGNDPLDEGLMDICFDAKKRFLKSNGILVPSSINVMALPVEVPSETIERLRFTEEGCKSWQTLYQFDFSVYQEAANSVDSFSYLSGHSLRAWPRLSSPILLRTLNLGRDEPRNIDCRGSFKVESRGRLNGIFVYFEAELAKGISLSSHPDEVKKTNSWANLLWLPSKGRVVHPGQKIEWHYCFDRLGRKSNVECFV